MSKQSNEGCYETITYFQKRTTERIEHKIKVAKYIVEHYLHEGDSIILDAGTSLSPIADEIVKKTINNNEQPHYSIMTHNYDAFGKLVKADPKANLNIFLTGGRHDNDLNALFGLQTQMAYEQFFPKVVMIGISGIVADQGLFCHGNTEELAVKKIIFNKPTGLRIIIADYTKFGVQDALMFGETLDLRKNATNGCIIVTDTPEENTKESDIFEKQRSLLTDTYNVNVIPI